MTKDDAFKETKDLLRENKEVADLAMLGIEAFTKDLEMISKTYDRILKSLDAFLDPWPPALAISILRELEERAANRQHRDLCLFYQQLEPQTNKPNDSVEPLMKKLMAQESEMLEKMGYKGVQEIKEMVELNLKLSEKHEWDIDGVCRVCGQRLDQQVLLPCHRSEDGGLEEEEGGEE